MVLIPIGDDNRLRRRPPVLTGLLVLANVLVYLWQWLEGPGTTGYAAVPYELTHFTDLVDPVRMVTPQGAFDLPQYPGPWPIHLTMVSAMFMHADLFHILFNMWFLWIFGDQIEDLLGRGRFLLFYLLCGLFATLCHVIPHWDSPIPTLGASGAVAGVLGAYFRRFPLNRIRMLFFIVVIEVPAFLTLGLWIAKEIYSQVTGVGGAVAYLAHIGGFAAGFWLVGRMGDKPPGKRYAQWRRA